VITRLGVGVSILMLIGVFPTMTATPATPGPFFMFTAAKFADPDERSAIADVLRRHVSSQDYLGRRLGEELPELALRIGRDHLYLLAPSLAQIARHGASCGPEAPGLIIYDGEHWRQTPLAEQQDMVWAVAEGKALARHTGCGAYGIAPDGQFLGIIPATGQYDLERSIHRRIDWDGIALFDIQAQRLLEASTFIQSSSLRLRAKFEQRRPRPNSSPSFRSALRARKR
jgi:hypothetical protein